PAAGPTLVERIVDPLGLEQHVPEALGPVEIDDQEDPADGYQRERQQVAQARQRAVLRAADDVDERGQEVRPRGEAAKVKVEDDPPAPVGIGDEEVHADPSGGRAVTASLGAAAESGVGAGGSADGAWLLPRLRKENSTPSAVRRAAKMLQNDEP